MKNASFLLLCLTLISAYGCLHLWMRGELNGDKRALTLRYEQARTVSARASLDAQLARFEIADWRQHVATLLPGTVRGGSESSKYPLRNLASLAAGDAESHLDLQRGVTAFERAKKEFRDRLFEESNESFRSLIESFPGGRFDIEAHFLLAEGEFQTKDYERAVDAIDLLVGAYPESDLTGYALLRLGGIFELQGRREDADEVYRAILKAYLAPGLVAQARTALTALTAVSATAER